jgi:hypothetical protein
MYKPDFRTINDFRKNNLEEITQYFINIVRFCKELGMIKIGQVNIDGTKIKANASNRLTKNKSNYEKWLEKIDTKMKDIFDEADKIDAEEDGLYGDKRGDELPEEINTEEKLKRKIEKIIKTFKKGSDKEKINLTDPDAKFMKGGNGKIDTNYNCQAAVTENQIIIGCDVITEANDRNALENIIKTTEEVTEEPIKEIAADSGYSSYENYEYLAKNKKTGYIPDQNLTKTEKQKHDKYLQENFRYDEKKDVYTCPEGKELIFYKKRRQNATYRKWRQKIYKAGDCHNCCSKKECTTQPQRTIARDERRVLLDEMRKRLLSEEGQEKYKKRLYTTEPVFGNIKHNLGYRYFLLRTLEKVKKEFKLMCIGHNLRKIHKFMTLPVRSRRLINS